MYTLDRLTVTIVAEDSVGYETPYLGQHGVSFLLEAQRGAKNIRLLVDVAQHPVPLLHNMELMGIDPHSVDALALTHCHYDHTQGLARIIEAIGRANLPVIAHPDIFRPNFEIAPSLRSIGVPLADGPDAIAAAGGQLMTTTSPLQLIPGLTTSGEVPRVTEYENNETALHTIRDGEVVVDEMIDELSVYAVVKGIGTVVITGCSHAGVINIVRHAKALTGQPRVHAVIGGFHLIEADRERIARTAADLKAEPVERILAGHCTGFPAQVELHRVFNDAFEPLRTGQVFMFA